jgi:apolipoprotein N-acyltransferase
MKRAAIIFWLCVVTTAVLLRVTAVGPGALALPLVLVPLFAVLFEKPAKAWAFAGGAIGLVYAAAILVALAKWGLWTMIALWLSIALAFAVFFGVVGAIAARAPQKTRAFAIAGAWCGLLLLIETCAYTPVYLTAPLAPSSATARTMFGMFGVAAVEGLVVLMATSIAAAITTRRKSPLIGLALPVTVVVAASFRAPPPRTGDAVVHVVQPNFSSTDYLARSWSLEARHHLTSTMEELTTRAARRNAGTILWPENGTGLAETQLSSRRDRLQDILRNTQHDLVVAGLGYDETRRYVAAVHLDEHAVKNVAAKTKLVPLAESEITPGEARVFDAVAGRIGISVCFDVMFRDHVARLVDGGADVLAVTSDNASFGVSLIPAWHEAYAIMRAAELERSIVFGVNRGPSVAFDVTTNTMIRATRFGERNVATVQVGRTNVAHHRAWHVAIAFAAFGAALISMRRRAEGSTKLALRSFAAVPICAVVGISVELIHIAAARNLPPRAVVADAAVRGGAKLGIDAIAPQFRQSDASSSGRAALAYALTTLGDHVFEESFRGTTDLASAAARRGFSVNVIHNLNADQLGPGRAAVIELEPGRFAVIAGTQKIFDPKSGRVTTLNEPWTGQALLLSLPRLWSDKPTALTAAAPPASR